MRAPIGGDFDLFVARRASTSDKFGTAALVPGVTTGVNDVHPMLTDDELTLVFSRFNAASNYDLWVAHRQDAASPFVDASALAPLNSNSIDYAPFLTADAKTLVYYSAAGTAQLYAASFPLVDGGTPIERVGPHVSDSFPVLTADGMTMYFSSKRSTPTDQIYVAHRETKTAPFATAILVPAINDPTATDYPSWISPDGCHLYMGSTRVGNQPDLYVARRFPR